MRSCRAFVPSLLLLVIAPAAWSNGRFPATSSVNFRGGDPSQVFVGVTFGALLSTDRGASWRWICEQSMQYGGGLDPVFSWTRRGTIFGATFGDLIVSRDNGCTFTPHQDFVSRGASDVVEHPTEDDVIYVATSGAGLDFNAVFRSRDGGRTFAETSLKRTDVFFSSVRFAPSNPRRIYVAGWRAEAPKGAFLFHSDDAGETWTELRQEAATPIYFYVLAVSPTNPDVVLTLLATTTDRGDLLRRSDDAGATATTVFQDEEGIKSAVFSPDGNTAWVAGLSRIARSTNGGRAFDGATSFARLPKPTRNACVAHDGTKLWACGWQFEDDFALAVSDNGGDTMTRVYNLADVRGTLSCPAGTTTRDLCEPLWPALALTLGVQAGDAGAPADAGFVDAGAGDGGSTPPPPGKSCACGASKSDFPLALPGAMLWVTFLIARRLRRKARS